MESENEGSPVKRRKKGVLNAAEYKRNIIKNSRLKGKEYVSHSGKVVNAIKTGKPCSCRLRCFQKFDDIDQAQILSYFLSFQSKDSQDSYLTGLIEQRPVKRRRSLNQNRTNHDLEVDDAEIPKEDSVKKNHFFDYKVQCNDRTVQVCKTAFCSLFGIGKKRIERICVCVSKNQVPHDLRGRSVSNIKPEHIRSSVHNHMNKFPTKTTHYGGKIIKYLDCRLDVATMHRLFLSEHPDLIDEVKYSYYLSYFKFHFGYRFGRPQVDVCSECERLSVRIKDPHLNPTAKKTTAAEFVVHKRRAKKFYTAMKDAKENSDENTAVISFDYMQNLPLPAIPVQEVFYLRQLWCFVFGIHNLKTNKAKIYCYHEGEGRKTPNEICSFLLDYINTEIPPNVENLILFSDGCIGQNKNHTVLRFFLNLSDNKRFKSIKHYFPVRGHSFLPCDRDFGSIKRLVRKADRIYTIEQYMELIKRSSKIGRFTVKKVKTSDIIDFKSWWPKKYKKTTTSEVQPGQKKEAFKITNFRHFEFNSSLKGKIVCGQFVNGFVSSTFGFSASKGSILLPSVKAYPSGSVPINPKKLKDISTLANYVREYDFYVLLQNWPTEQDNASNNEDSENDDE